MGPIEIITALLNLFAGIGIFLIACTMMSSNLESISSEKLKALFSKTSKSKLLGVGIGTVATAAIQSSGATSVMVIGFVNAGIMSLMQAATIIYGANIGTTITGQIVALGFVGGDTISTTVIFGAFAGIGAFMSAFTKKDIWQKLGGIFAGFGMLFIGLKMMSSSMESFAELEAVRSFLALIKDPILLILIGAILTAIIQSSSVMTSVAIAMVVASLITLDQGIYLTMGSNIGSCVVAIIAGITSSRNAKRTALIHLLFNVSGVIAFFLLGEIIKLSTGGTVSYGVMFEAMFPSAPQTQLAMFHTVFNVITVIIILPLTELLIKLVTKIIPISDAERKLENDAPHLYYIDDYLIKTPPIAVQQTKNEVVNMARIALENYKRSLRIICTKDFSEIDEFRKNEKELNFLNKEIVSFVVRLSQMPHSQSDHKYLSTVFHSTTDLERIGDYAENIIEYADKLEAASGAFSSDAIREIHLLEDHIERLYEKVMDAYINVDLKVLEEANVIEEIIDDLATEMADNHIKRLNSGVCTPDVGAQYMSLAANSERVADHFINVAKTIRTLK